MSAPHYDGGAAGLPPPGDAGGAQEPDLPSTNEHAMERLGIAMRSAAGFTVNYKIEGKRSRERFGGGECGLAVDFATHAIGLRGCTSVEIFVTTATCLVLVPRDLWAVFLETYTLLARADRP